MQDQFQQPNPIKALSPGAVAGKPCPVVILPDAAIVAIYDIASHCPIIALSLSYHCPIIALSFHRIVSIANVQRGPNKFQIIQDRIGFAVSFF